MDKKIRIFISAAVFILLASLIIVYVVTINQRYESFGELTSGSKVTRVEPFRTIENQYVNDNDVASIESSTVSDKQKLSIDFTLLVLSSSDQKAVVLTKEGRTQLVSVGEYIGSKDYKVLQITSEKLVLQHPKSNKLYWLFESKGEAMGRIQEFSSTIEGNETGLSSSVSSSDGGEDK